MRSAFFLILLVAMIPATTQNPLYYYTAVVKTEQLPQELASERSVVIFSIPDVVEDFVKTGNHHDLVNEAHQAFIRMHIDPVMYVHDYRLQASPSSRKVHVDLFIKRKIKSLIFLTQKPGGYELMIAPFSGDYQLIKAGSQVFFHTATGLSALLLKLGKVMKRADQPQLNFLVPEKPEYLQGISIVENTLLKNYPGVLRRSKLAVERFSLKDTTRNYAPEIFKKIQSYNVNIEQKNKELENILTTNYPYEWELIDPMDDDQLIRRRYQFVMRSISGPARSVRQMLSYELQPSETMFASVIPTMPDQKTVKMLPENAMVHKFFIRQNISKNVHVGVWDADVSWQGALRNALGNLIQEIDVKK